MIECSESKMERLIVHYIGNKHNEELCRFSNSLLKKLPEAIEEILCRYFLSPFKTNEYYHLTHESDLNLNEMYTYACEIFDNTADFTDVSKKIGKHLYEQATHPKIKGGEFYAAYFSNCIVDGEETEAIGLFKSESKDTYLRVMPEKDSFNISSEEGINISKLEKGCLIFNTEKEKGFLVAVVDAGSKGNEAQYWKDHFLHLKNRSDSFHHTKNILTLCKHFVTDEMPEKFDLTRADQADMLNKSVKFFKENENFEMKNFAQEVMQEPEVIKAFKDYKKQFQYDQDIEFEDKFEISKPAVKKQQKIFKSVIKLDKNFHVYVHGDRELIEKGYDEDTKMHYYKL